MMFERVREMIFSAVSGIFLRPSFTQLLAIPSTHTRTSRTHRVIVFFIVFSLLFGDLQTFYLTIIPRAQADTLGPRTATVSGDCVNDTATGTVAWTSPGNAYNDNGFNATVSVDGTISNYIKCTNFGFTIPTNSRIDGIVVTMQRLSGSTGNGGSKDAAVRVVKGGTIGADGNDRYTATTYTTSEVSEDHGSATDLWGDTWTTTDINSSTFGAAVAVTKPSSAGAAHTVSIDAVLITVYYSPPIDVTGTLYSDEGTTANTSGGKALVMRVGTSTPGFFATTTLSGTGAFRFTTYGISTATPFSLWADADTNLRAFSFTKAATSHLGIANFDLYQNRIIVKHEGVSGTTTSNAELGLYDGDDDADIQFTSNANNLVVRAGQELHVASSTNYVPGGTITLHGNASSGIDGDLHLAQGDIGKLEIAMGRDVKGDTTGVGNQIINSLAVSGNYLYAGKVGDATACNGTAGNAIGCELLVFDISTPASPTIVAGRDVTGDSTGTGSIDITYLTVSGNYLYVGKGPNATACNGTAGNAIGCEILVFDISTPFSPTLVAGRDVDGSNTGAGSESVYSLITSGNYLYVGRDADATACNGTAGNAIGCELLVFDISTPTSPTLVAGRDVDGGNTGGQLESIYSLITSGNYLYLGKTGDATACNGTAGNAIGCELLVFDISTPSSPTLVAGRDVTGNSTGTGDLWIRSLTTSGNYLYAGKGPNATACNGTAGNAIGCELLVFDISTLTNPVLVAGRDVKGDSTGTGYVGTNFLAVSGNYLYLGKTGDATACNGTAGNAVGCELLVFDISTPTSPTLVAGRDVKGDSTGTGSLAIYSLTTSGNYLYAGKGGDGTACNGTAGNAIGCELMSFVFPVTTITLGGTLSIAGSYFASSSSVMNTNGYGVLFTSTTTGKKISGELIGDSAFASTTFAGSGGGWVFTDAASTTADFRITSGAVTAPSSLMTIGGDYINSGTFTHNGGAVVMNQITPFINQIAGRDATGDSTGIGNNHVLFTTTSGNYLYVGKSGDSTACNGTAGNAIGCELLVFDISTPATPTLVAGRDSTGNSTGTGFGSIYTLTISGNYLYVGKAGDATACNGTAGNATGCELLVFDISTPTNPTLVAGRDATGSSTGTGNAQFTSLAVSGNYLYVGKYPSVTACNGTAGNAIGCELLVFDISTPTSPTLVAGRDVNGDSTGTGNVQIDSLATSGNYLYAGKGGSPTACNGTAGNAIGCELLVFDISTPTSPTLVAGRDVKGDSTGTGDLLINSLTITGNYLYVAKNPDGTACNGTAGNAIGCELQIYDISTPTSPTLVAGRDSNGDSTGMGSGFLSSLTISGNYLYVGQGGNTTACNGTPGNATGCELQIYDILTPTSPTLVAGRDSKGDSTGTGNAPIESVTASGNYLYVGKQANVTACNGTPGNATGCELSVFSIPPQFQTLSGSMTGANAFHHLTISDPVVASSNASTTGNLTTSSGGTFTAPSLLTVNGNYSNSGTLTANSGTIYFGGSSAQSLGGTMTGTSSFFSLDFLGAGAKSFSANASTTANLTIESGASVTAPSGLLSIGGNYINNGSFANNSGTMAIATDLALYLAGRDAFGSASGTGYNSVYAISVSGNYAYVGKSGDATACSQVIGSAVGCELMVFDISNPSSPIYVAGRDVTADSTGIGNAYITSLLISGNYLYVGKVGNATACSQSAGSAIGCELQVYDITTPTSPTYVAGRDASADSTGTGSVDIRYSSLAISGSYLYLGKTGNSTACSQTAGSAIGCELLIFDISTPTSPTYVAGRDVSGNSTGTGSSHIYSISISGNYAYVAQSGVASACSQTAGSAIGCEFQVYDISTPTNPTYVAGRDVDGSATGSGSINMNGGAIYGNYIYLGTNGDVTACAQTAGSAIGCELQVYDITTPTSPTYVAGRDSDGSAAGIGNVPVYDMVISGNYLYVARFGNTTACSQVPGSAAGCELIAFDISTPLAPTYVAGRDSSGNSSGTGGTNVNSIAAFGGYLYGVKTFDTTACSQTAGSAIGCEFMVFRSSASLSGNLAGTSAFNNLQLTGSVTMANNASSSNLTINATSTLSAPTLLSISGNYINSGTFIHNSGLVYLNGSAQQTFSGNMIGSNAFNDLTILNNYGTNAQTNPGIIFANTSSTTGTFTATVASTSIRFPASATTSMTNIILTGTSAADPVFLRSSVADTSSGISVSGTRSLTFVDVKDLNACSGYANLSVVSGTNSGNNSCWDFVVLENLIISGTLYSDEGVTAYTGGGKALRLRIGTSTPGFFGTTTLSGTGFYRFPITSIVSGISLSLWVDGDSSFRAYSFTKASSTTNSITNFDLYENVIRVKHEGILSSTGTTTSNAELGLYDSDDDSDIQFTANGNNLVTNAGQKLLVAYGTNYVPGGTITTHSSSTAASPSGDFQLEYRNSTSSMITLGGTLSVAGSYYASTSAIMNTNGYGVLFTATTTGKQIQGELTGVAAFGSTTFNGVGGAWTFGSNASSTGDFTITNGSVSAPPLLTITGNYANSGTFTAGSNTVYFSTTSTQTISGNATGTSAFYNIVKINTGTTTFSSNASTTNLTISSGTTSAPALLSIAGNYINSGTFTHNSGLVYLNGSAQQTFSGNMIGTSAFNDLTILNNYGTNAETNPGIIFANTSSTTGTFTATVASTSIRFPASATTSMTNIILTGTSAAAPVFLRSSTPGSYAGLSVSGARSVTYADVQDSGACSGYANIDTVNSTNSGNNICWSFPGGSIPALTFLHYRWRMDHESEVSAGYYKAEDTALLNQLYKGDRLRLRTTIENTGTGPATDYDFRLEYASSSCTAWSTLGTSAEWYPDLTQYALDGSATTDAGGLSNPDGLTFQPGVFRSAAANTGAYTLPANYFTEHEFSIASTRYSTYGLTYCFRITNAGSVTNFTNAVQPQFYYRGDVRPHSGGSSIEVNGVGPIIGGGGQGGGTGAEGSGSGGAQGGGSAGGGGDSG